MVPIEELKPRFLETYGDEGAGPVHVFYGPGRVNLIGEHIDYNGGLVFPAALSIGIGAAVRFRDDRRVRLVSLEAAGPVEADLDRPIEPARERGWGNYPLGVMKHLEGSGRRLKGCDVLFHGDLPDGAGLSSSAAIEVLTGVMALHPLEGEGIDRIRLAALCREAENSFVGVSCGIMDQFAVAMGKEDHAILLDCSTLEYRHVPLVLGASRLVMPVQGGHATPLFGEVNSPNSPPAGSHAPGAPETRGALDATRRVLRCPPPSRCGGRAPSPCGQLQLVIINTRKRRELGDSKYNERRRECDEALRLLRRRREIANLVDAAPEEIERHIADPVLRKRARHVVAENLRVREAVRVLGEGNLAAFGSLMAASHVSLKNDYEVTGPELDAVFELSMRFPGCIGARMTGAGFGGCAIALVGKEKVEAFMESVGAGARSAAGIDPEFYLCGISGPARRLETG
jgi:galactokinase